MWIEIKRDQSITQLDIVTPFTGVWIEIFSASLWSSSATGVTPFTGVWIEIYPRIDKIEMLANCHSLHGSVD